MELKFSIWWKEMAYYSSFLVYGPHIWLQFLIATSQGYLPGGKKFWSDDPGGVENGAEVQYIVKRDGLLLQFLSRWPHYLIAVSPSNFPGLPLVSWKGRAGDTLMVDDFRTNEDEERAQQQILWSIIQYTVGIGYCDYHLVTLVSVLIGYCDYFPNSQKPISVL